MITERYSVACRLVMKAISRGCLANCFVHVDTGSTDHLANKNFEILSMLIRRHYPAGFFMLIHLSEIDVPLVAPIPFRSLPYLLNPDC